MLKALYIGVHSTLLCYSLRSGFLRGGFIGIKDSDPLNLGSMRLIRNGVTVMRIAILLAFLLSSTAFASTQLKLLDEIMINGIQHSAAEEELQLRPGDEIQLILYSLVGKYKKGNTPKIRFTYFNKNGGREHVKKLYYNDHKTECGDNPTGENGWGCQWSFSVNNRKLKGGKYVFSLGKEGGSRANRITFTAKEYKPSERHNYLENPTGDIYVSSGVLEVKVGERDVKVFYDVTEDGERLQGDMILGKEGDQPFDSLYDTYGLGRSTSGYMWPNNTVIYKYSDEAEDSRTVKANFEAAMKIWSDATHIKFKERTTQSTGYVLISIKDDVCQATVGYRKNEVTVINVDEAGCGVPEVIHELEHTLGAWHEQTREDRGSYIDILTANIRPESFHNFDKHDKDYTYGKTAYDRRSIMHYGGCAFAKDLQGCYDNYNRSDRLDYVTIDWKGSDFTFPEHQTSVIKTPSAGDIALIKAMYPPSEPKPCTGCNCPTPEPDEPDEPEPCKGCGCPA